MPIKLQSELARASSWLPENYAYDCMLYTVNKESQAYCQACDRVTPNIEAQA